MNPKSRIAAALLSMSAAGIIGLSQSEGFAPNAMIPVPGDVPTYGLGSTTKADGTPVQMGDTITLPEAEALLVRKLHSDYEPVIKKCASDVLMTQGEYDAIVDLAYNIGAEKVCRFSIVPKFRSGRYAEGCAAILTVDMLQGVHCSRPENLKHFKGCKGIMNRRNKQYATCIN